MLNREIVDPGDGGAAAIVAGLLVVAFVVIAAFYFFSMTRGTGETIDIAAPLPVVAASASPA